VIDLHCHVLAGIDDGPETMDGSLALARAAASAGTRTIVATPHVSWRYGNDSGTIAELVAQTNATFSEADVGVTVLAGAEIAMTRAADLTETELAALTLGGGPWLLIECPFTSGATGLDELIIGLEEAGHGVVLAHPERSPVFQRDPQMLESLVRNGVLTSITAGSLVGRFGATVRRFALGLMEAELVHNVASDAHDAEQRRPGIADELREAGLEGMTEWLTESVPAAIIAGEDSLPPRPQIDLSKLAAPRPSWWRRGPLRRAS
jgi:protein-tyrosine phosphatase